MTAPSHKTILFVAPRLGCGKINLSMVLCRHEVMVQSTVKTVTAYLEEVPIERKSALVMLRELCRTTLLDFEESMRYGGPCYSRNGVVEVGFASQKNFIGLYILRTDVMSQYRDMLQGNGISVGKGVIRYARPDKIDFKVVGMMLKATQKSTGVVC